MDKIKLDIVGKSDISTLSSDEQWSVIGAFADAIKQDAVSADSVIDGEISITTAKRTDVDVIEKKFPGVIKKKNDSVLFDDPEVFRILMEKNFYGTNYISQDFLNTFTGFQNTFYNNPNIVSFEELPLFKNLIMTGNGFSSCVNLERVNLDGIKFRDVNFGECSKIKELDFSKAIFSQNISFQYLLRNCSNIEHVLFPRGVKVTNMFRAFYECSSLEELDVSMLDMSVCTTLERAFESCRRLMELNLSTWDTSACTTISYMFYGTPNIRSLIITPSFFNGFTRDSSPLKEFGVSPVTRWVDTQQISDMLSMLPDLTGFSDGRTASLRLSANTFAQVTSQQVADAAAKGWNVYK